MPKRILKHTQTFSYPLSQTVQREPLTQLIYPTFSITNNIRLRLCKAKIQELTDSFQRKIDYEHTVTWPSLGSQSWLREKRKGKRARSVINAYLGVPCWQTLAHSRAPIHTNQQEKKYMKKIPAKNPALVIKWTLLSGFPADTWNYSGQLFKKI